MAEEKDPCCWTCCHRQDKCKHSAKPGDLIEIDRQFYQHWAVYIGNDEVIHLTIAGDGDGVLEAIMSGKAMVTRQNIWEVVLKDAFRVNNLLDEKYEHHKPAVIVEEAIKLVGQEQPYNLATSNCEHFATNLRYGHAESRQVRRAVVVTGVLATVGACLLATVCFCVCKKNRQDDVTEENL